ncbi:MAG: division/cell wall cluster transcriptional repressor MraZ [Acidimicrobiia bacterium]
MDAFFGEFSHSLDDKGRLILPAKFRPALEGGAMLAAGQAKCLAVYTHGEWEGVATRTKELAREGGEKMKVARFIFSRASSVTPDTQGRVLIPPPLREYAGLERDVYVIGNATHIEIWDAELWREQCAEGSALLASDSTLPGILV